MSKNHSDPTKAHPMHLCGKCQALGSPCYKLNDYDPTEFEVYRKVRDDNDDDYYDDNDQAYDYGYDEDNYYSSDDGYDNDNDDNNNVDSYGYYRDDPDSRDYYGYE